MTCSRPRPMYSTPGTRHISCIRCLPPRHAARSRSYRVRYRRRTGLDPILRYRTHSADCRWIREVNSVLQQVRRTAGLGPRTDTVWHVGYVSISPVGDVIRVHYHQYADDMQLYVSLRSQDCVTIPRLEQCATDVSRWFTENAPLLNPTKTEAVIFGTSQRLSPLRQVPSTPGVLVAGAHVKFSDAVKLLGVTLE